MSAYIVAQMTVHDLAEFDKYVAGFSEAFTPSEGRVLVASDQAEVIEGEWPKTRTVVLEFPSMDHAKRWYNSPAYQDIAQHRFKAATSNLILTEGWKE